MLFGAICLFVDPSCLLVWLSVCFPTENTWCLRVQDAFSWWFQSFGPSRPTCLEMGVKSWLILYDLKQILGTIHMTYKQNKVLKHTGKLGHSLKTFFYIYLHMSCIGVHTLQSSKIIYHFCAQQFWQLSCLFLVHGLYRLSFVHGFSDLWFNAKTTCPNHWSVAETQTDVAEHLSPFLVIWCLKWGIHGLYAR